MHGPDGRDFQNRLMFEAIEPPARIVSRHGGDGDDALEFATHETRITLDTEGDKTRLTWRLVFASIAERDRIAREYGAVEGGQQTIGRLAGLRRRAGVSAVTLTLYCHPLSSYSWKVLIALYENGNGVRPGHGRRDHPRRPRQSLADWQVPGAGGPGARGDRAGVERDHRLSGPISSGAGPVHPGRPRSGLAGAAARPLLRSTRPTARAEDRRRPHPPGRPKGSTRRGGCPGRLDEGLPRRGSTDPDARPGFPAMVSGWPTAPPRPRSTTPNKVQSVRRGMRGGAGLSAASGTARSRRSSACCGMQSLSSSFFRRNDCDVAAKFAALHKSARTSTLAGSTLVRDFYGARHRRRLH